MQDPFRCALIPSAIAALWVLSIARPAGLMGASPTRRACAPGGYSGRYPTPVHCICGCLQAGRAGRGQAGFSVVYCAQRRSREAGLSRHRQRLPKQYYLTGTNLIFNGDNRFPLIFQGFQNPLSGNYLTPGVLTFNAKALPGGSTAGYGDRPRTERTVAGGYCCIHRLQC